jgi:chemotaxis protein MotB
MSAQSNAPIIIIKRKKVIAGGGHHGGAWKVAYADFVTAMMAFFLLMWLLNATTEVQRKGIADYFNPTIPINRISGGGADMFGGDNIFSEQTLAKNGTGATQRRPGEEKLARGDTGTTPSDTQNAPDKAPETVKSKIEEALTARSGESMVSPELGRHIVTRVTDEGLIVELFDLPDQPLFDPVSELPTDTLIQLTDMISKVFELVTNQVAVNGFVSSQPVVLANNPIWDRSSARADKMRLLLQGAGLHGERIQRVSGYADRKPAARNPMAARNNRLELILLRAR